MGNYCTVLHEQQIIWS